jgi:hypothetical protein
MTGGAVILVNLLYQSTNIYLYQECGQELAWRRTLLLNTFWNSSIFLILIQLIDVTFKNYDKKESILKSSSSSLMLDSGYFFEYFLIFQYILSNIYGIER